MVRVSFGLEVTIRLDFCVGDGGIDNVSNIGKAFRTFSSLPNHEASTSNLENFDKNSSESSNFDSGYDCSDLDSERVNLNNLLNMESTLANDISKISNNDNNKISKSTFSKLSNF
ncbi:hypothetical protein QTP88_022477 [Uroleucon formosanum]